MNRRIVAVLAVGLVACAQSGGGAPDTGLASDAGAREDIVTADAPVAPSIDATTEPSEAGDASVCDPADMLVVVDRSTSTTCGTAGAHCASNSMCCSGQCDVGKRQCIGDGMTMWVPSQQAIDFVTQAPTDTTIRFGLELLPDSVSNASCGYGDYVVPSSLGSGAAIASTLATTTFHPWTPIGGAMQVAENVLAAAKVAGRKQYVTLLVARAETCSTNPALPIVQSLAASGVSTFVVGMGAEVDASQLNDLACAGHTAASFSTSCTCISGSCASAVPATTHVYYEAVDELSLQNALATITSSTCCGCNVPIH